MTDDTRQATCAWCADVIVSTDDGETWMDGDGHQGCPARGGRRGHDPEREGR
jgi:hypothetical protein